MIHWIGLGAGVLAAVSAFFWRRAESKRLLNIEAPTKKQKRPKKLATILMVAGIWLFLAEGVTLLFGTPDRGKFTVEIFAPRVTVLGYTISSTVLITWAAMLFLIILALILRFTVLRRLKDVPTGAQNVLEIMVDGISSYTESTSGGGLGDNLCAYFFTVAALMVASAMIELFGLRAPTADITMTFSLALITFILINYYGIRQKGVKGRIKSLAEPTPVVFPMRVVSDFAVPVSLACRLFGNMLGGMIVMELLYSSLGNFGIAIPSVVGLYFNVFHPLIQVFIFVTLSLTFIREAAELTENEA
ncbi:MAG: F0F1 ATP synthase subunit A [Eubacteriales bacterium]|nr:F0F1 ATP synthase subunit A [Eubacteriales bacterium]